MLLDSSAANVLVSLCIGLFGFSSGGGFSGRVIEQPNLGPVEPQSCGVCESVACLAVPCQTQPVSCLAVNCIPAECITTSTSEGTVFVGYSWTSLVTPVLTVSTQLLFHALRRPLVDAVIDEPLAVTVRHVRRGMGARQRDVRGIRGGGYVA